MVDTQSPSSRRCKVGASGHCIETHFSLIQVIITPHCQHPLSTARPDFPSTDYLILLTCFPLLLSSPIINTLHSAPGFPQHGHLHGVLLRRTKVTPRPPPHPSDVSPLDSFVSVTTLTHPRPTHLIPTRCHRRCTSPPPPPTFDRLCQRRESQHQAVHLEDHQGAGRRTSRSRSGGWRRSRR